MKVQITCLFIYIYNIYLYINRHRRYKQQFIHKTHQSIESNPMKHKTLLYSIIRQGLFQVFRAVQHSRINSCTHCFSELTKKSHTTKPIDAETVLGKIQLLFMILKYPLRKLKKNFFNLINNIDKNPNLDDHGRQCLQRCDP